MKRLLVCCIAIVTLGPTVAFAQGLNISWNDCGAYGPINRSFACNTNDGVDVLVASFAPPSGITKLTAIDATIAMQTADATTLGPWWRLADPGACRSGSLTVDADFTSQSNCLDYWAGRAMSDFTWTQNGNRACLRVRCHIPEDEGGPVTPGEEYYAFKVIIDHAHAVGAGACPGCNTAACFVLEELWLVQPAGMGDIRIKNSSVRNFATWQGGIIAGGCPPIADFDPNYSQCAPTPTLRSTWGAIKTLYR